MITSLCAVALAMAGCIGVGVNGLLALIAIAGIFFGAQSAPLGAITQTLGGPRAAGQWMGVQNLCANVAGVLAPLITGLVVAFTGRFVLAFAVAAGVTLLGALTYAGLLGRVTAVEWQPSSSQH